MKTTCIVDVLDRGKHIKILNCCNIYINVKYKYIKKVCSKSRQKTLDVKKKKNSSSSYICSYTMGASCRASVCHR